MGADGSNQEAGRRVTALTAPRYRLVIFDLDGTLADSYPWFLQNLHGVLERFGLTSVSDTDIERLRGAGPREILDHLGVRRWKLPMIARHIRRLKSEHIAAIPLFQGVDELLQALRARGITLAMVSSDDGRNVRQALGSRNASLFAHYACSASMFGKARKFRRVLRSAGVGPAETLCIGDEIRDLEAAREVGVAFGAVSWGYTSPDALEARAPDALFTSMPDILKAI